MSLNQSLEGVKLIIGLGNPGAEYQTTYHNIGQKFLDYLAGEKTHFRRTKHFEYANLQLKNLQADKLILIKPLTSMNQSGEATLTARKYFNSRTSEILVIHDDSDISLGNFKLSFGRGSAGHKGVESIIKSLKTAKFYRLRIGIRPPKKAHLPAEARRAKAGQLVLKKIPLRERRVLKNLFGEIRASLSYPH